MGISNSSTGLYLHVDFPNAKNLEFDRRKVRKAYVAIARDVQHEARRLVSRRAVSKAGEAPGMQTGALEKSIGFYVPRASKSRPGFMAIVRPNQPKGQDLQRMPDPFYPAFLFYGVRRGAKRGKSHKAGASGGTPWRIEPRKNFMAQALINQRYQIQRKLFSALKDSVKAT